MLTPKELLSLAGPAIIIVFIVGFLIFLHKSKKDKGGFRAYLVGRIIALQAFEGIPVFTSRHDAVKYVALMAEKFKYDYASRNESVVINGYQALYDKVVDDLCEFGIIPKNVYRTWR
jgi:hypothetical protein